MGKPADMPVPHAINPAEDEGRVPAHLVESLKQAAEDVRLGRTVDAASFLDDLDRRIADRKTRAAATRPEVAPSSATGA